MMKNILLLSIILAISCSPNQSNLKDNQEIIEMYNADQADRVKNDNWVIINKNDILRRMRIEELLDSNKIITSVDYKNAAMIFQHGEDSNSYKMAIKMMQKSIDLDSTIDKWLYAAATDRYLMSIGKSQIYGTQYIQEEKSITMGKYDTTIINDSERIKYGVKILEEQKVWLTKMNLMIQKDNN